MELDKLTLLVHIAQGVAISHTNIAESYKDWLTCCFACASFGEAGREPYHLISSVSSKYRREDTDTQFSACLRAVKDTNNIAPLLSLCKSMGFILRDFLSSQMGRGSGAKKPRRTSDKGEAPPPLDFPQVLPRAFADCLPLVDNDSSAFALLHGLLVATASVLDTCGYMYAGRLHHLNIYACCVAPPASGKSILSVARTFLRDVHDRKRRKSDGLFRDYRAALKDAAPADRDLLSPPPLLTHYLPADTSVSALLKTIADNGGGGVIWESELDTLTRNFKSDYGNFSDGLRNNWAGEQISYNRKTSRELLEINDPHFSVCVSCTPAQVTKFFGSAENGLFSRFLFSRLPTLLEWRDQWSAAESSPLVSTMARYLVELEDMARERPCVVKFSAEQQAAHNKYFAELQETYYRLCGAEMLPIIRRLGVTWGRVVSVLTLLDAYDCGYWESGEVWAVPYACQSAFAVIERAASDAAEVLLTLPPETPHGGGRKDAERAQIYANLPSLFSLDMLPSTMSQAAKYRLLRMWLDAGKVTKDGTQYHKVT